MPNVPARRPLGKKCKEDFYFESDQANKMKITSTVVIAKGAPGKKISLNTNYIKKNALEAHSKILIFISFTSHSKQVY